MIPRTLVPPDARPTSLQVTAGRPTALDERTLISGTLPIVALEEKSKIPANLPLDSIAARVVVPRDVNQEANQASQTAQATGAPSRPTALDERTAIPVDAMPPEQVSAPILLPTELVEGDVITTGEVQLLVHPVGKAQKERWEFFTRISSGLLHAVLIALVIWQPKLFQRHPPTAEEQEIARRQFTLLLPPGAFDLPAPVRPPQPRPDRLRVDPRVLNKVAPPALPEPAPVLQPEPRREVKDLPSAPMPQANAQQQAPPDKPEQKTEVASNMPLKLETPDLPKPQQGLVLPKFGSNRPVADPRPQNPGSGISGPRPTTIQNIPLPRSGGGQSGRAYGGMAMLTPDQGVDFTTYLARVQTSVDRNWQAVIPESVNLGEKGKVILLFRIMRDGSVPPGYPMLLSSSSKEPLDRAAISSIRASNPFEPLPSAFTGPYIDLQASYLYNLPLEALNQ
jgi:outer membrane biosynthesis protein TonB